MKRVISIFIFSLFFIHSYTQNFVSTTPENKNIILEHFSGGINSGWAAEGDLMADTLANNNPGDIFIINIHEGGFASPLVGQPDFRTSFGTDISLQTNLIGYPAGTVNRHEFPGLQQNVTGTAMSRLEWSPASSQLLVQPSPVNVGVQADVDFLTNVLTVDVEVYYTGSQTVTSNMLNVVVLQHNVEGPQSGGSLNPSQVLPNGNYNHQHMLRHLMTGQWGGQITNLTPGSLYSNTYTWTMPVDINGVPLDPYNISVVAFVAEGQQEILNGTEVYPNFVNLLKTYVPDDNFEQALINLGYDNVLDDSVATTNINTVTYLNVDNQNIADLTGIEDFTALTTLYCSFNFITTLDLSYNLFLDTLACAGNLLTSLDLTSNIALKALGCRSNLISSLDISSNIALEDLDCNTNQLISLDVSNNPALTYLYCHSNLLTNLDVTQNTALIDLGCSNNQLTSLDVSSNTVLTTLYCGQNLITSLDPSNNTALVTLDCGTTFTPGIFAPVGNLITSLDLSNNVALSWLSCSRNQIAYLNVSNNPDLWYLQAWSNQLTFLDVSNNPNLVDLQLSWNNLSSLDITNNPLLKDLYVMSNQLTSLDVSQNDSLTLLYCDTNNLTALDVSNNTLLAGLICASNNLESLNIQNTNNVNFDITSTGWWSMMPNGYSHSGFNATNNPNLNCINVDDNVWANANWTVANDNIDVQHYFGGFCTPQTNTPDNNFETYLEANGMGNGVLGDDSVSTINISSVANLNVGGLTISDLTGIEDFGSLQYLDCSNNNLTDLDVSNNTQLSNLQCEANILNTLSFDVTLTSLDCFNNQLTSLDLSNNPNLTFLNCSYNNLAWIDLRNGNNQNLINPNFTGNPYCSCIAVDDPPTSDDDWPWDDPWSVYSTTCNAINSWNCVGNDCLGDSTGQGIYTVIDSCQITCGLSSVLDNDNNPAKELIKVIDVLGRHTKQTTETLLFYLFDDGTVEKRITIE